MSGASITRHITSETPRVMVVDGSKVVRRLIEQVLRAELPGVEVVSCETGADAQAALQNGVIDLVTTALRLPDMDGLQLARYVREHAPQAFIPIIVVSGDVNERLVQRSFSDDVTDYFDKSLGFAALGAFIRGYVRPEDETGGDVLYVEDSKVVAVATRRMLEKHGLRVSHVVSVEDGLDQLQGHVDAGNVPGVDLVLTDVYLKGGMTGHDLLEHVRGRFAYSKAQLPILVMTGDDNPANQSALLRAGANDLVEKPIEERLLVTKLLFQLRVGRLMRQKVQEA
ncbi:MAG: response regulator [Aquimonas sp.]|nr:response regulator [Aquimonas sp.]